MKNMICFVIGIFVGISGAVLWAKQRVKTIERQYIPEVVYLPGAVERNSDCVGSGCFSSRNPKDWPRSYDLDDPRDVKELKKRFKGKGGE